MKKILLVDDGTLVRYILDYTDWEISLFLCSVSGIKNKYISEKRIKKYVEIKDILNTNTLYQFNFSDIEYYNGSFKILDYGLRRYGKGMHFIHYQFFNSIAFWEHFFKNETVDFILLETIDHGTIKDCVLKMAAAKYMVPLYQLSVCHFNVKNILLQKDGKEELIEILNREDHLPSEQFGKMAYYAKSNADCKKMANIKKRVHQLLGNGIMRLYKMLRERKMRIEYPGSLYSFSVSEYYYNYFYCKWIRHYVSRFYKKYDCNAKYIVYFLHFEPEAFVSHYSNVMDSQLVFLQMLSENLPSGWKLYVKEHPDMYKVTKDGTFEYYLPSQSSFFDKFFVDKMVSLKNVEMLNVKISAEDVISNAMAVASICGTVTLDAVLKKKNILLFANSARLYYSKCSEFFCINSVDELQSAIKKISKGFVPEYTDFLENMDKYGFVLSNFKEYDGYEIAVRTISDHVDRSV